MADLVARLAGAGPDAPVITELWALDSVHQGDSGVLNDGLLGDAFNWADNGRDILAFIINHINSPQALDPAPPPPTPLTPAPSDRSLLLLDNPTPTLPHTYPPNPYPPQSIPDTAPLVSPPSARTFGARRIIGVGHSLGGGGLAFAASALPSVFAGAILVDPVLPPLGKTVRPLTMGALVRREEWASRAAAREGFLGKPFFRAWDERVLAKYVEFGLKDKPKHGGVALKTKAKHEAVSLRPGSTHNVTEVCADRALLRSPS